MERVQFEDLMMADQKFFARYAALFMESKGAQSQSFLDWCWEKYLDGTQPSPNSTGFGVDFYSYGTTLLAFPGIRLS
jgi:hypothetical protein